MINKKWNAYINFTDGGNTYVGMAVGTEPGIVGVVAAAAAAAVVAAVVVAACNMQDKSLAKNKILFKC